MPRQFAYLVTFLASGLFAGCSTPLPVLDRTHPASVDAPESSTPAARSTLRRDETSRMTRELLKQREQQAKAAESEPPADQTYIDPNAPKSTDMPMPATPAKPMKMEGHEHQ